MNYRFDRRIFVVVVLVTATLASRSQAQAPLSTGTPPRLPVATPTQPWVSPFQTPRPLDPRIAMEYQELETRLQELTRNFHAPGNKERRAELRGEIEEVTNRQFELKNEVRHQELKQLRQQLEEVEAKVQRREELREQIVQRRVAELTREDAELKWDNALRVPGVQGPLWGTGPVKYPSPVAPPAGTARGSSRGLYDAVPPTRTPAGGLAPQTPQKRAGGEQPVFSPDGPNALAVAEAEARLEIAKRDLEITRGKFEIGLIQHDVLAKAEGAFSLAEIACRQARRQLDTRRKLMDIEIQKAELELEALSANLNELEKLAAETPSAISRSELQKAKIDRERAQLNLQQLETMNLSLHAGAEPPKEEPEREPRER